MVVPVLETKNPQISNVVRASFNIDLQSKFDMLVVPGHQLQIISLCFYRNLIKKT